MRSVLSAPPRALLVFLALLPAPLQAQSTAEATAIVTAARARLASEGYVVPAPEIAKLVTATRNSSSLGVQSPDRTHFVRGETDGLPTLADFARPHHYFAGLQVDPAASRARSLTTRGSTRLSVVNARTGTSRTIAIPAGARVTSPVWSPDGRQLAYVANFPGASQVYVADIQTGTSRPVTPASQPLLATLVTAVDWTQNGTAIAAVLIPANRGPEPVRPAVASGPLVRLWTDSAKSPQRNFASLLQDPFEQVLMEYHTTGQLAVIDVRTRSIRRIGAPAMISSVDPSPDGKFFRVTTIRRPFSYIVQYQNFGQAEEIWDAAGSVLAEVSRRPLREAPDTSDPGTPGPPEGNRRSIGWLPAGGGLYYLEAVAARSGGPADSARSGPGTGARPDRLVRWSPPFGAGDTATLYRGDGPLSQVVFTEDGGMAFFTTTRAGQGEIFAVALARPEQRHTIIRQRNYTPAIAGRAAGGFGGGGGGRGGPSDSVFYGNPGALMTRTGGHGLVAVVSSDSAVYLSGIRYDRNYLENIPRSFVDKIGIRNGTRTRVYEGPADVSESLVSALDDDLRAVIVTRESPSDPPNAFRRDLAAGTLTRLTHDPDPAPEFTRLQRHRVVVTRADGVRFVVRVTLPADYRAGSRLPGMLWLYPYEYTDQAGYDRTLRTENVKRFMPSGTRSIEYLATQGYAVANFDPPIIGEQGRMNDNYVSDLRMNLYAVIEELDRRGFIDRSRLAIGGHSYGAFSTVNALVHTPFFRAGIAGDGMYNRTLTPNGFQSERRDLWSGQKTYLDMSPMLYTDKMQGALLMYHGLEDQNVGTDPISSVRMMQALRAQGKVASLYLYPYEDHGPATRETLLDLWGRWTAWLDVYVKHPGLAAPRAGGVAAGKTEGGR